MPLPPLSALPVVELRQYTLRPGARADLVELFERELVEPQEDAGMRVGGIFLDRDDPDRFAWFRGYPDLPARRRALEAFYLGPVWRRFRDAANATMVDSDDVLMLRPTDPPRPPLDPAGARAAAGAAPTREWVTVSVYLHPVGSDLGRWLAREVHPVLEDALETPVAAWRTEPAENTFPALPVRAENAFVWSAGFVDREAHEYARRRLGSTPAWRDEIAPRLERELVGRRYLRLQPTGRSQHPATDLATIDEVRGRAVAR